MKKNILIAVVVIGAAFGIGFLVADRDSGVQDTPTPGPVSASATPTRFPTSAPSIAARNPVTHTVRLTASGMVPGELRISAGDLVVFTTDVAGFWPASDPHPTHTLCPGFDAKRALGVGDRYEVPFLTSRTCLYHDHLNPSDVTHRGTIIVQ